MAYVNNFPVEVGDILFYRPRSHDRERYQLIEIKNAELVLQRIDNEGRMDGRSFNHTAFKLEQDFKICKRPNEAAVDSVFINLNTCLQFGFKEDFLSLLIELDI